MIVTSLCVVVHNVWLNDSNITTCVVVHNVWLNDSNISTCVQIRIARKEEQRVVDLNKFTVQDTPFQQVTVLIRSSAPAGYDY